MDFNDFWFNCSFNVSAPYKGLSEMINLNLRTHSEFSNNFSTEKTPYILPSIATQFLEELKLSFFRFNSSQIDAIVMPN